MQNVNTLVIGATGYVGSRLVPRLLERGHRVRCLVRNAKKAAGRSWAGSVDILTGDVLDPESLRSAFQGIEVVYYLVHSMATGPGAFEQLDRQAAQNVAEAAAEAGVQRIIYLGGLGDRHPEQSPHLRSRHEVAEILRRGSVPVTEFRAAVIVGSGSLSFELIHHLVNRLPVMICPRWVYTRTQPIGIADVLRYLAECLEVPETTGRTIDIGGPEILTYRDMMLTVAKALGLRRYLVAVPVLTPRLSSYWVNLVTPIQAHTARALIESLRSETVCKEQDALKLFPFAPMPFSEAVTRAISRYTQHTVESVWTDAGPVSDELPSDSLHLKIDRRECLVAATAESVYGCIASIGGDNGWYYGNRLWRLRGFLDQQIGGVGLRRGRRHPTDIAVGDALDFWRVVTVEKGRRLLLRAEMRVWGKAWLEFLVEPVDETTSTLVQQAWYYPRGLFGLLYWYGVYPVHAAVFRGMIREIARRAESGAYGQRGSNSRVRHR